MTHNPSTKEPRKQGDRPFPWRCGNCLQDEVYLATMPYTATVKHDGRIYEIPISEFTTPKCRNCAELIFTSAADDQMTLALRKHLHLLTPRQIRAGRKTLGLKAKEMASRLGVAAAT